MNNEGDFVSEGLQSLNLCMLSFHLCIEGMMDAPNNGAEYHCKGEMEHRESPEQDRSLDWE